MLRVINLSDQKKVNHWITYRRDRAMRIPTRSNGRWYRYLGIRHAAPETSLHRCTIDRATAHHVFCTSITHSHIPDTQHPYRMIHNPDNESYKILTSSTDDDNGALLAAKLQHMHGRIVGDGSYDQMTGVGSCTTVIETTDQTSRLNIGYIVLSNPSHGWNNDNDPYRCELYAIAIGLYTIRDLEMRHNT